MRTIALLLAGALTSWAAAVTGKVVDARGGEALARVRVQLVGADLETLTDAQGRFALPVVAPGNYTLNVETVGYRLTRRDLAVNSDDLDIEVVLSPDMFRRTDSVDVTAGPFDPVAVASPTEQTLIASEIKNLGTVLMDDPVRALHSMPGVSANNDFYSQFSVRGAPYQRVGFYLDDVLLHMPFHTMQGISDGASVSMLNTDMLDSVSLLPGAFPARYADRAGAAVDVRTRDGSRTKPAWRGAFNMSSATGLGEGPIGKRASWMASVRKSYLQHLVNRMSDDPSLAVGFLDWQTKLTADITQRQAVSLHLLDGTTDLDRTNQQRIPGVNAIIDARYRTSIARAGWRWTPDESLVLNAAAAWMRERYDNLNRDRRPLGAGQYGEWVGNANLSWFRSRAWSVDAGWSSRRLRDDGFAAQFFNNTTNERVRDIFRATTVRHGGYGQQTATLGRLRISTGLRWDRHDRLDHSAVSPQASLALRLDKATELQLGWGQYVQYPEVWQVGSPFGGTRLLPERSTHHVAAIERRLGTQTRLRLEAFERIERDLLARPFLDPRLVSGRVVVSQDRAIYNSVRGYARGAQVVFQRRSANRVTGWVGYTLLFTRQRDGVERLAFPSIDDQRHGINTWLSYRLTPSLNLSAAFNYGTGTPIPGFVDRIADRQYQTTANRHADSLGDYARLDLRANKSFSYERWKFTFYGELINATNHKNFRVNSYDGVDTRTGRASVSVIRVFPILPSAGLMLEF